MGWQRMDVTERLMAQISPEPMSGCWLWMGATTPKGYGHVKIGGRNMSAHRASYEILKEEIPEGMQLDHKCRTRCCVNPDHLEPVSLQENVARGNVGEHNRSKTECANGHPYSPDNTMLHKDGSRRCRKCRQVESAKYRQKRSQHR